MSRGAAILLALATPVLSLPVSDGLTSVLAHACFPHADNSFALILAIVPLALLLPACAGKWPALQAVAAAWILLVCGWTVTLGFEMNVPIAGLAALSFLEGGIYPRRPPPADPEGRFLLTLLWILAGVELAVPLLNLLPGRIAWATAGGAVDYLWQFAYPAGSGALFLVVAWGFRAGRRWSAWLGCALCAARVASGGVSLALPLITGKLPYPLHAAMIHVHFLLPTLCLHLPVAILLGRRVMASLRSAN